MKEGDRNTKFLHRVASLRNSINSIKKIKVNKE